MNNDQKCEVLWELSSRAKESLGKGHLLWLLDQENPAAICRAKLEVPGATLSDFGYRELLDVLIRLGPSHEKKLWLIQEAALDAYQSSESREDLGMSIKDYVDGLVEEVEEVMDAPPWYNEDYADILRRYLEAMVEE